MVNRPGVSSGAHPRQLLAPRGNGGDGSCPIARTNAHPPARRPSAADITPRSAHAATRLTSTAAWAHNRPSHAPRTRHSSHARTCNLRGTGGALTRPAHANLTPIAISTGTRLADSRASSSATRIAGLQRTLTGSRWWFVDRARPDISRCGRVGTSSPPWWAWPGQVRAWGARGICAWRPRAAHLPRAPPPTRPPGSQWRRRCLPTRA
jgi:hypothetical protein